MAVKKIQDEDLEYPEEISVFHVVPDDAADKHVTLPTCWCEPILEYKNPENGNEIWNHRYLQ